MTIIHISSSLGGGGAEQMVLQLARQKTPDMKHIVFSISEVNTLEEKFTTNNIEVHFLNITSFKNSTLLKGLKKLNATIKEIDDAIFHCHQFHGCLLSFFYNRLYTSNPIVFTLHSSTIESSTRKLILWLIKPFRKKDIIFSNNAKKWYLKNSVIIPNGVDFDALSRSSDRNYNSSETFTFLFLGRLSAEKNPLSLIEFAKKLNHHGINNFIINVVGDGNLSTELNEAIQTQGLASRFSLLGFQNNVKTFLNEAHCLLLPSLWEGLPMVIIEAAAARLPIIATPVGSIPDFLNNTNAYICTADQFHEAMETVIKNYDEAVFKTKKLYTEIKSTFDIANVYASHLEVYQSVSNS